MRAARTPSTHITVIITASHAHDGGAHVMVLIGDSLHGATGVVITAAFLAVSLRVVTSLRSSRTSTAGSERFRATAFLLFAQEAFHATSSLAHDGRWWCHRVFACARRGAVTPVLAFAASLLYVAVADLIPSLHRQFSYQTSGKC